MTTSQHSVANQIHFSIASEISYLWLMFFWSSKEKIIFFFQNFLTAENSWIGRSIQKSRWKFAYTLSVFVTAIAESYVSCSVRNFSVAISRPFVIDNNLNCHFLNFSKKLVVTKNINTQWEPSSPSAINPCGAPKCGTGLHFPWPVPVSHLTMLTS